jgi:predicted DNA-binding transcriptional regulator AlpA
VTNYLDIDELAERLGQRPRTIRQKLARNPQAMPPRMHLPGSALLRWRAHEVENWIVETGWVLKRPVDK